MPQENPRHLRFMTQVEARILRLVRSRSHMQAKRRRTWQDRLQHAIDFESDAAARAVLDDSPPMESGLVLRGEVDELLAIVDHLIDKLETEADRREEMERRHMALGGDIRRRV